MTIDQLVLLKMFAIQQAYLSRILETQAVILAKLNGAPEELQQEFATRACAQCDQDSEALLRTLLKSHRTVVDGQSSYVGPELSDSTVEEFLRSFFPPGSSEGSE